MFFSRLLKGLLISLGCLLIGFGIGMIISENFQMEKNQYWLITAGSLILGGFVVALGIAKKVPKKKAIQESDKVGLKESFSVSEGIQSPEEKVES